MCLVLPEVIQDSCFSSSKIIFYNVKQNFSSNRDLFETLRRLETDHWPPSSILISTSVPSNRVINDPFDQTSNVVR